MGSGGCISTLVGLQVGVGLDGARHSKSQVPTKLRRKRIQILAVYR